MNHPTDTIEPKIRPLVDALNATGLVQTFASCEGHYDASEQTLVDRNLAYVQFVPAEDVSAALVEHLLMSVLMRFKTAHGLMPVVLGGHKRYTPVEGYAVDETFVLDLRPFNRFDQPDRKRSDTDRAIEQVTGLVRQLVF
jgi:hypothetical protein